VRGSASLLELTGFDLYLANAYAIRRRIRGPYYIRRLARGAWLIEAGVAPFNWRTVGRARTRRLAERAVRQALL
jgi:hypothetical protein